MADLDATIDAIDLLLPPLYTLAQALDRALITEEEIVSSERMRNPVAEKLFEAVSARGGVAPTWDSTSAPHLRVGRFEGRVIRLVDRRVRVTMNTAANRVLLHTLNKLSRLLNTHISAHATPSEALLKCRAHTVAVLRAGEFDEVGPMQPSDLMDRSLRYAPRYRTVLALHREVQVLRRVGR